MGREADCELTRGCEQVHVRAHLESRTLVFRGSLKQTLVLSDIIGPRVEGGALLFEYDGQAYSLALPAGQADKWLKALVTTPPSLRQKLGLKTGLLAYVLGAPDDPELSMALLDAVTPDPGQAALALVVARSAHDLSQAMAELDRDLPRAPVWVIYPKGGKASLPESLVRSQMRALGFMDTKACAVSDQLTATRFSPSKMKSG